MVIFHSYVNVYQRVPWLIGCCLRNFTKRNPWRLLQPQGKLYQPTSTMFFHRSNGNWNGKSIELHGQTRLNYQRLSDLGVSIGQIGDLPPIYGYVPWEHHDNALVWRKSFLRHTNFSAFLFWCFVFFFPEDHLSSLQKNTLLNVFRIPNSWRLY